MPIYAYGCTSCGFNQDVMQKMSDAPLRICPECGKETFAKKLTAASFQLKGSGYYVTDFKEGARKPGADKVGAGKPGVAIPDAVKPDAGTDKVAVLAGTAASAVTGSAT